MKTKTKKINQLHQPEKINPSADSLTSKPAEKPANDINTSSSVKKLEEVNAVIAREKALKDKEAETLKIKENEKLNAPLPPIPGPDTAVFEPSPQLRELAAGGIFKLLELIMRFFEKGLRPLTAEQRQSLEEAIIPLLSKIIPASFNQHQDNYGILFVSAGIIMANYTDLAGAQPKTSADKPPALPPMPEAKVTVITAEAPPLPEV